MIRIQNIIKPTRFRYASYYFKNSDIKILDIGCGNSSPSLTKLWFKNCIYHGVDIQYYNLTDKDIQCMDKFFQVTMNHEGYEAIPDFEYDFAIINHVIEHSYEPYKLARIAASKIKPGGLIWIAYPSFKSLSLPPGLGYTNHFCDDLTHISIIDDIKLCNALISSKIRIIKAGRSHDFIRTLIGIVLIPVNLVRLIRFGKIGRGMWYILGFEDRIIGIRNK